MGRLQNTCKQLLWSGRHIARPCMHAHMHAHMQHTNTLTCSGGEEIEICNELSVSVAGILSSKVCSRVGHADGGCVYITTDTEKVSISVRQGQVHPPCVDLLGSRSKAVGLDWQCIVGGKLSEAHSHAVLGYEVAIAVEHISTCSIRQENWWGVSVCACVCVCARVHVCVCVSTSCPYL